MHWLTFLHTIKQKPWSENTSIACSWEQTIIYGGEGHTVFAPQQITPSCWTPQSTLLSRGRTFEDTSLEENSGRSPDISVTDHPCLADLQGTLLCIPLNIKARCLQLVQKLLRQLAGRTVAQNQIQVLGNPITCQRNKKGAVTLLAQLCPFFLTWCVRTFWNTIREHRVRYCL